jgi:hypothetical protein
MQLPPEVINAKLGIICFDSRTFGVLAPSADGLDSTDSSVREPARFGAAQLEPELRFGATRVVYAGFSV